ncbi:hypothetical protein [Mycobacterium camsae]|uniref:hypothetical protein n=1 Tax=Mycobacterium gordonae TaxID=1778 RepID=UPI00197CB60A|nr:hypothetical protein [Mycobacterium gordonae]
MGILDRISARQRLRRATQESLSIPTFSAPIDCTPWVIGGLCPEEFSPASSETATLAECLKVDLQRIAGSANDALHAVGRAGMEYVARREAEARVIDEARDRAVRRVESTVRQLRQMSQHPLPNAASSPPGVDGTADHDSTQVPPATREVAPPVDMEKTQIIPAVRDGHHETTLMPGLDDRHERQQPDCVERDGRAEDAAKHRLRRADD